MFDKERLKQLRNLTPEERRQMFLAAKAELAAQPVRTGNEIVWHDPDDPNETPSPVPGESRTRPLWVKYRHLALNQTVVAKGYFDYDGGDWFADYAPEEGRYRRSRVEPLAWAEIVDGVRPEGRIIGSAKARRNNRDRR